MSLLGDARSVRGEGRKRDRALGVFFCPVVSRVLNPPPPGKKTKQKTQQWHQREEAVKPTDDGEFEAEGSAAQEPENLTARRISVSTGVEPAAEEATKKRRENTKGIRALKKRKKKGAEQGQRDGAEPPAANAHVRTGLIQPCTKFRSRPSRWDMTI